MVLLFALLLLEHTSLVTTGICSAARLVFAPFLCMEVGHILTSAAGHDHDHVLRKCAYSRSLDL
jgi:hypothetical protein